MDSGVVGVMSISLLKVAGALPWSYCMQVPISGSLLVLTSLQLRE